MFMWLFNSHQLRHPARSPTALRGKPKSIALDLHVRFLFWSRHDELIFGDDWSDFENVSCNSVRTRIGGESIESRYLVRIRGFGARLVFWPWLRPCYEHDAVMLLGENVQPRLRIRVLFAVCLGRFNNLPSANERAACALLCLCETKRRHERD